MAISTVASTTVDHHQREQATGLMVPWATVVWNDPVNLMSYVAFVFRSYFGHDEAEAQRLMLQVHHEGRAIVASGARESMELHTQAMHGYGLWATVERMPQ